MSGSFWKFSNGFTSLSNITTILENYNQNRDKSDSSSPESVKEKQSDVLYKLLDENDLLQELLSNNPMLLEFLREEDVLRMLVDIVISEENESSDSLKIPEDKEEEEEEEGQERFKEKSQSDNDEDEDEDGNDKAKNSEKGSEDSDIGNKDDNDEEEEDDVDDKKSDKKQGDEDDSHTNDQEDPDGDSDGEDTEQELPEEKFRRRATLAAEVLSADVWSLTDTVMESTSNLDRLWSVLDSTTPLNMNVSTHFMKIMEHLLDMKCDEMITYLIENQPNLVEKFTNHLSNPPLMDFLLKLISTDKPDNSTGIIDFLQNQNLISRLIDALDVPNEPMEDVEVQTEAVAEAETESEATVEAKAEAKTKAKADGGASHEMLLIEQSSAADFLKALITISANSTADNSTIGPNELTRELVSEERISQLCKIMLKGGYALANGVGIIIEIIRKNNSDYDILPVLYITLESHPPTGRDPIYLGHLLRVFGENIHNFNNLLIKDESDSKLRTPFGVIEPLGFERFKICELMAELLHCSNMALLNDNKGFDVVKERDELRVKMKEFDPVSFKYNETIVLPSEEEEEETGDDTDADADVDVDANASTDANNTDQEDGQSQSRHDDSLTESAELKDDDEPVNDTIDEFNRQDDFNDEDGPHANANLSEEEIRSKPVVGDFLKIALFDTQIISNILSMFFRFPWNNFLHNVVFDVVQQVLNGSMDIGFNKFLAIDLFHSADITNKIIEGQKLCTDYETSHNGLRLGFMGHLTLIAEEVVKFVQLFPANTLSEFINEKIESDVWEDYVSHVLYDTREKYNAILGGNDDDDDDEEKDDEENSTFDEGLGEIIEEVKTGLSFQDSGDQDPEVDLVEDQVESLEDDDDHDDDHGEGEGEGEGEVDDVDTLANTGKGNTDRATKSDLLDSDESESDDDDQFSNFMAQQLASNSNHEVKDPSSRSDEIHKRLDSDDSSSEDSDEYIDPNDDGMSYKKSNPLYDNLGILKDHHNFGDADDEKIEKTKE
ncbi:sporulation-induced protein [Lodderomyces elongisporus]|uniref:sporulation-induced protein n=1 Tax=Lodderomyces elongisporus TaxID=36914 RepID=UPI002925949A|nr:sporulation-induced protein [Lodderomyces elongisporus]WLF81550.1 sporulation-induced protein [Lodderomyces elongisporus]